MAATKSIEDLPTEMLVEIFLYVPFDDLVQCIQFVNTRWKAVSQDNCLWKYRPYSPGIKESDCKIARVLAKVPGLQTLIIDKRSVRSVVLNAFVNHCPQLKKLILPAYQKLSVTFLENLVRQCPDIEELCLPKYSFYDLKHVKIIGQLDKLKHLSCRGWREQYREDHLRQIADGCPPLESLNLNSNLVTNDGLEYFLNKNRDQLRTLDISWCTKDQKCSVLLLSVCTKLQTLTLHMDSCIDIARGIEVLRNLKNVTSLNIFFARYDVHPDVDTLCSIFRNQGMSQLLELQIWFYERYEKKLSDVIFNNCTKLKCLSLRHCNVTCDCLQNIYMLCDLENLFLRCAFKDDEGVALLTKCKKLKHLYLEACGNVTDEGMKLMAELHNLETLNLDFCDIKGLSLHLIPTYLVRLSELSIINSVNIDRESLSQLKVEKPHLDVYENVGENNSSCRDQPSDIFHDASFLFQ